MTYVFLIFLTVIFVHVYIRSNQIFKDQLAGKQTTMGVFDPAWRSLKFTATYFVITMLILLSLWTFFPSLIRSPLDNAFLGWVVIGFLGIMLIKSEWEIRQFQKKEGLEKIVKARQQIRWIFPLLALYEYYRWIWKR